MPASPFIRASVSLSVREDSGIVRAPVDGMAVRACPELAVTRGYRTTPGCWNVTHAPTGRTVTRSLYQQDAKRAALAIADALVAAGVRVDTDNLEEVVRRLQSVPDAMAAINAAR